MHPNKFLKISIVFLVIIAWIFSGWPRIWEKPAIPPEIEKAQAAFSTGGATCTAQSKTAGTSLTCTISSLLDTSQNTPGGTSWIPTA